MSLLWRTVRVCSPDNKRSHRPCLLAGRNPKQNLAQQLSSPQSPELQLTAIQTWQERSRDQLPPALQQPSQICKQRIRAAAAVSAHSGGAALASMRLLPRRYPPLGMSWCWSAQALPMAARCADLSLPPAAMLPCAVRGTLPSALACEAARIRSAAHLPLLQTLASLCGPAHF